MALLNLQQQLAVEATEGPVAIIAGPGTGKTKTLAARITHLVQSGKAQPNQILALTFTKKAAQEMAERINQTGVVVSTFHALCSTLLDKNFTFATEQERQRIIKELPKPQPYAGKTVRELALLVSLIKNQAAQDEHGFAKAYNHAMHAQGLVDFDDLLVMARDLLLQDPTKRPAFSYVLVDEFQDTNALQYQLLKLLLSNDNIFVIGDPNQSIYGFRGAHGSIFESFKNDFAACKEITLGINYRSAPQIVALANSIFADSPQLSAFRQDSGSVRAIQLLNEYSEAQWVLDYIQQTIGGGDLLTASHHEQPRSLKDIAIVYRTRHAGRVVQKYIADSGLPFQVVGEGSPYAKPEAQTLIALLRACDGQAVAAGGCSQHQVQELLKKVDTTLAPADLAAALMATFGLEKSHDLLSIVGTLVRFATLKDALAHLDSIAVQDFYDSQAEAITLLTIHASKGLEFPVVCLVGVEDGVLPATGADMLEEKRLFYVAVTRAKDDLAITYSAHRTGKSMHASPFITEIPTAVLPKLRDANFKADAVRLQKRQAKRAQTSLF
ncbi:MAG TPA: ATP-dependent helicase [Candidatus Saccharimonadales bacterium]|nr:ATP-dependent helicase [Candidatus Saccharimonadales bacterium]